MFRFFNLQSSQLRVIPGNDDVEVIAENARLLADEIVGKIEDTTSLARKLLPSVI